MWTPQTNTDQTHPSYKQRVRQSAKEAAVGWTGLIIAVVLFLCAKSIYGVIEGAVDDSGWVEHSRDTPVWISGEWMTGEYRVCKMPLMPRKTLPSSAHLLCGVNYAADEESWPVDFINSISEHGFNGLMGSKWDAVEQYFHVLPVKFWGRIDRGDRTSFSWRCQRKQSEIECKALN